MLNFCVRNENRCDHRAKPPEQKIERLQNCFLVQKEQGETRKDAVFC